MGGELLGLARQDRAELGRLNAVFDELPGDGQTQGLGAVGAEVQRAAMGEKALQVVLRQVQAERQSKAHHRGPGLRKRPGSSRRHRSAASLRACTTVGTDQLRRATDEDPVRGVTVQDDDLQIGDRGGDGRGRTWVDRIVLRLRIDNESVLTLEVFVRAAAEPIGNGDVWMRSRLEGHRFSQRNEHRLLRPHASSPTLAPSATLTPAVSPSIRMRAKRSVRALEARFEPVMKSC